MSIATEQGESWDGLIGHYSRWEQIQVLYAVLLWALTGSPKYLSMTVLRKEHLLTVKDVARYLHCHQRTVIRHTVLKDSEQDTAGKIPTIGKIAGQWRYRRVDVEQFARDNAEKRRHYLTRKKHVKMGRRLARGRTRRQLTGES
jgi:hypothetical protein